MKTRMIKRKGTLLSSVAMLSTAMLLTACGGDGGDSPVDDFGSNPGEGDNQGLLYAYPDNGQSEVPTKAPIALRFTSAVSLGDIDQSVTLCCDEGGGDLAFTSEKVSSDPRGVLLTPTQRLQPQTEYTVQISDLRLNKGTAQDQTLTFKTRPLQEGPKNQVVENQDFMIDRQFPNGLEMEPYMDFSSFRFQFTQPIDRTTATYGDGNTVVLRDSEGLEVDAGLLVDGAYMTIDPTDDYLAPGETYTLELTGGLESTYGETFAGETIEFTPKDSSPRGEPGFLVQRITQDGTSRLTGKGINQVPVNGTLLGEDVNVTQAQSELVIAELADVTQYTDVTPIRLPKGTLLEGTPIEMVKIGGAVDAGFGSGDVTMRVLSDATGYLVPNPYTEDNPDQLRIVHLFMDVGIATENPQANGGFTQNLMHIHLVGVAEVDPNGGVLNIDATSMVEPDVLGLEYGYGLLSFQLQSYKDQTGTLLAEAKEVLEDITPPDLLSWTLGTSDGFSSTEKAGLYKPGDAIVLNFDEALDPQSIGNKVTLYGLDGITPMPITYFVDGAALVIKPEKVQEAIGGSQVESLAGVMRYIPEGEPLNYNIIIDSGITDIAGNPINSVINESIPLPRTVENKEVVRPSGLPGSVLDQLVDHAPVVLATYPGFPCRLDESTRDLGANVAGRCAGGMEGITEEDSSLPSDITPEDDLIPISTIPYDRPIVISFSENIDPESIVVGGTFSVERIDNTGAAIEQVPGRLVKEPRRLLFYPHSGWVEGQLYQYVLQSAGYEVAFAGTIRTRIVSTEDYTCGIDAICDEAGLPLQTQVLGAGEVLSVDGTGTEADYMLASLGRRSNDPDAGGPDLVQYFRGGQRSDSVLQSLSTAPVSDTNANFYTERDTPEEYYALNVNWQESGAIFRYNTQEYGPTTEDDPYSDESIDPNGVRPSLNSAKVLSLPAEVPAGNQAPGLWVSSINTGCGFQEHPQGGDFATPYTFSDPQLLECPENKFTYLTSSLMAEVTSEVNENGEIKVLIWPSVIMASSIDVMAMVSLAAGTPFENQLTAIRDGATGPQIMRMRYAGENRDQPIEGWIQSTVDGPVLKAEVDLYLDIPGIADLAVQSNLGGTNMASYPVTMNLTGPVDFSDDGRMIVQQHNLNPVNIRLKIASASGTYVAEIPQIIPERGSLLQYISEPIK